MGREPTESQAPARLTKPAALRASHYLEAFDSGRPQLDEWLKKRALAANDAGTARTFVVCRNLSNAVGYVSLCAGSIRHEGAPGSLRRNAPDPIPVIILARFAVSREVQGRGLGKALLADAMKRAVKASAIIGARALVVHALDETAARFYERHGFSKLTGETYFIAMKTIVSGL